jgi:hypothetical protein
MGVTPVATVQHVDPVCGNDVDMNTGYGWYVALIWVPIYNVFVARADKQHAGTGQSPDWQSR